VKSVARRLSSWHARTILTKLSGIAAGNSSKTSNILPVRETGLSHIQVGMQLDGLAELLVFLQGFLYFDKAAI